MTTILPALALQHVTHRFGSLMAVDDVSLYVNPGEIVCLLGPSGCGKSTILRLAAGLETLHQGHVFLRNAQVARPGHSLPPEERGIGLVFQDFALFPHLTVSGNIAFGLRQMGQKEKKCRVQSMLTQVGMSHLGNVYPHVLSGGQQQRVALARALAPNPSVLLLDEPFSDLDQRLREQIRDDTLHVLRNNGTATLLVTHDPDEAMFMADRIYLMREGRVEQTGTPFELYNHPINAFAAEFFGPVNQFICQIKGEEAQTPFGSMPLMKIFAHQVCLLVRPEAVLPHPNGKHAARIGSLHFLGAGVHLELELANGTRMRGHLSDILAWQGHGLRLEAGASIAFDLAPSRTFIFPV